MISWSTLRVWFQSRPGLLDFFCVFHCMFDLQLWMICFSCVSTSNIAKDEIDLESKWVRGKIGSMEFILFHLFTLVFCPPQVFFNFYLLDNHQAESIKIFWGDLVSHIDVSEVQCFYVCVCFLLN